MVTVDEIKAILAETLHTDTVQLDGDSPLLGALPELDSMGVISLLTELETRYHITLADDEVDASIFETVGTLQRFVATRVGSAP